MNTDIGANGVAKYLENHGIHKIQRQNGKNPVCGAGMYGKINRKVDTTAINGELANYEKQLRQFYSIKTKLAEEIDSLDPDDRLYIKRKADLDDRLYRMYDKIEDVETRLIEARAKKQAVKNESELNHFVWIL